MKAASIAGCVVVLAALSIGAAARAADDSQAAAEKYILDSEAAWAESAATSDTSVVKRILADDVVWVLDGRVLDKSQAIAAATDSDLIASHLDYAHVRFFGDTAAVQGAETWTRRDGSTGHFVWADTWVRRNAQWQIVLAEDSSSPVDRPLPCGAGSRLRAAR
jgi:uncharacterized protein DUF4440